MRPDLYFELLPPDPLRGHVHAYWGFDVHCAEAGGTHTVWPDACLALLCRYREGEPALALFSGPRATPLQVPVQAGDRYRGIRFLPHAGGRVLGRDPRTLRDRTGLAAELLGDDAAHLCGPDPERAFEIMEAVITPLVLAAPPLDPVAGEAVRILTESGGLAAIGSVADELGVDDRQLRRRFRTATGLSPKEFARVRRLRSAAERKIGTDDLGWSALAARFGFADQAHLVREVARMTGLTRTAFERRLRQIEHRGVRP